MNDRSSHRPTPTADAILNELSRRQFVHPRQQVGQAVADAADAVGGCVVVAARAVAWLELDPASAVGRLKRTELAQLARCLARFWRQARPAESTDPRPQPAAGHA